MVYRNPDTGRVSVDLITEEGNIALHVNPRYRESYDVTVLVVNSLDNGTWGRSFVRLVSHFQHTMSPQGLPLA